jgi:prolyl 4-hydroxylase
MKFYKHTPHIFTVENFLTSEECKEYIDLSEKNGYDVAKINTEEGQRVVTQVRNNNRSFYNSKELARKLWGKAKSFVPEKLGNSISFELNELFRFYRYQPGQQFRGHYDESYIQK